MKKIKIISNEVIQTVSPLCTMSTIKDGESGFIRQEDVVIYQKEHSNKQYLRIKRNAPIYKEQDSCFMISICNLENEIEIDADPEAFFYVRPCFDLDPIDFTEEVEIINDEYLMYNRSAEADIENKADTIIQQPGSLQEKHRDCIDYCYSLEANEHDMDRLTKLISEDIQIMLATMKLSAIYILQEEILFQLETLNDKKERLSDKYNVLSKKFDPDDIPNYRILGKYLKDIEQLIDNEISDKIKEEINVQSLSKLNIDELVDLREKTNNKTIQKEIETEIQNRTTQQLGVNKRGGG
jgi:hypothetical protein